MLKLKFLKLILMNRRRGYIGRWWPASDFLMNKLIIELFFLFLSLSLKKKFLFEKQQLALASKAYLLQQKKINPVNLYSYYKGMKNNNHKLESKPPLF